MLKPFKILLFLIFVPLLAWWLFITIPWFDSLRFGLRYLVPGNTPFPPAAFTAVYDHNSWLNGQPWPQQSGKITVSYDGRGHLFLQGTNDCFITIEDLVSKSIVQLRPHDKEYEDWLNGKNKGYKVKPTYTDYVVQVRELSPRLYLSAHYDEGMFKHTLIGGPRSLGEKEQFGRKSRGWQYTVASSSMEMWFDVTNRCLIYGRFADTNQSATWKLMSFSPNPLSADYFKVEHYVKDLDSDKP